MKLKVIQNFIDILRGKRSINPRHISQDWYCGEACRENLPEGLPFYEAFKNHDNYIVYKWEQYLHIYNKCLVPYILKNKPVNLLEIGILNGGSIELWKEFLPEGSKITGIDINPECAKLKFSDDMRIVIGNACDKKFLNENFGREKFDIIIDDGSHICSDVINTFEGLFDKLADGGLFIIEDLHTSYWDKCGGGLFRKNSTMEYFKRLADSVNFDHVRKVPLFMPGREIEKMKFFNRHIASLTFYDSVIIIEKYSHAKQRPFKIVVAGSKDIIYPINREDCCNKETIFEKIFA
jgi:hypothetical protein